jgi:hypothetical protein
MAALGCQEMRDQPRLDPLEASDFFDDGVASRPLPPGTVPRGHLNQDPRFAAGRDGNRLAERFPVEVTRKMLERGQERYNIFCAVCHGRVGDGLGMVVRRGFKQPPSYHTDRLRSAPPGYFFDVMTNGFGTMPSYAAQVEPADRWAIAAYIRALQLSQNATLADFPEGLRPELGQ